MFTGIIESQGKIVSIQGGYFSVSCDFVDELVIGQSIAHDGACMTLTNLGSDRYTFFAMGESFAKTNLSQKNVGDTCNIERCLQANGRLDGHFVTGHIDGLGTIIHKKYAEDGSVLLGVSYPSEFDIYVVKKGSITINGVSLTIAKTTPGYLYVRIIPHTGSVTNLGKIEENDNVNLEFDLLAKYIYKQRKDT